MNRPLFKGVITALITPFRDGKVDEAAFRLLLERQIEGGVDGVVPVGTTGESATVSADEHKRIVELCVEIAAGRVRVIAGAGASATDMAIDLVRHAKTVGADGELVVTPAQIDAAGKEIAAEVAIRYGTFLQSVIDFVIVAFVIFLVIKAYNRIRRPVEAAPAAPAEEVLLLREIRDSLKR